MSFILWLGAAVIGYCCGAIPFCLLIGLKRHGIDIRKHGSGNVGATNLWRTCGFRSGLLGFFCDMGKGLLPTLLFKAAGGEFLGLTAGIAAVVGHIFPVSIGARGGKGVATMAGVLLVLAPHTFLYSFFVFLIVGPLATRTISGGSLAAAALLPFVSFTNDSTLVASVCTLISLLVIYRHRENIRRLYNGTERKIWEGRK
ncbi:MAG: glycerol-3-phosphate 1-O-acyltransferase [Candidatus Hydrogenedentota bacterium]|nr:MAG: glycerol-3-phosphate 1-O-acyltransferase [Candidatus Hydrogenedentota bacterium]